MLEDPAGSVRAAALHTLGYMGPGTLGQHANAVLAMLEDSVVSVRVAAVRRKGQEQRQRAARRAMTAKDDMSEAIAKQAHAMSVRVAKAEADAAKRVAAAEAGAAQKMAAAAKAVTAAEQRAEAAADAMRAEGAQAQRRVAAAKEGHRDAARAGHEATSAQLATARRRAELRRGARG